MLPTSLKSGSVSSRPFRDNVSARRTFTSQATDHYSGRLLEGEQACSMRSETIAVHGGYNVDPTTRAVAVPIYQTVAYAFDSAAHESMRMPDDFGRGGGA
jgi:hypothetical protein